MSHSRMHAEAAQAVRDAKAEGKSRNYAKSLIHWMFPMLPLNFIDSVWNEKRNALLKASRRRRGRARRVATA